MAVSDQVLPSGVAARELSESDLAAAMALSQEAGWNQTAADWRLFLELGHVVGLTRSSGALIATAATLPHGGGFGWISMVLVTASERRRGLARWLLRRCMDDLIAKKLVPVLDATPAGRMVYLGLGFNDCWAMRRAVAQQVRSSSQRGAQEGATIRPIAEEDWSAIIALDTDVFGADRSRLLRRLAARLPAAALVAERHGRVVGFLLGRDGRTMNQLGPLAAGDESVAGALLSHALHTISAPLAIDLPDRHSRLGEWLSTLGFKIERPLTRMVYGRSHAFDDTARLFAIAGPELG
ncbi:MAG TPA: GNAT family N-acetyltransferase [Pseudolabrys sp.]|uniref:GNAT family N-acetyltransferase n=1 Tax=Pseudolabrys sp. TaxID=1960880 RepID=UPI002DDD6C83|nr:GNAT family N-acetyltransferase [Pseudolabrys sp.]HEV2627630.1 GNAT family N-acetyltransferase [Pseudolabrys sp.]